MKTTRQILARKRSWGSYLNQNSPNQSDCQLVTAINAYYFLTGKTIKQDSKLYEKYRILCGAVAGAAICIEKVHKRLGIKFGETFPFIFWDGKFQAKLPIEIAIWHKAYGFHSVLIVDCEPITKSLRITNASSITNLSGWIYQEDLNHYVVRNKENASYGTTFEFA